MTLSLRNLIPRLNSLSRFGWHGVGKALLAQHITGVFGVDFEEVVENDHEDGCAAEEDGEGVEGGVGDHCCGWAMGVLVAGSVLSYG